MKEWNGRILNPMDVMVNSVLPIAGMAERFSEQAAAWAVLPLLSFSVMKPLIIYPQGQSQRAALNLKM